MGRHINTVEQTTIWDRSEAGDTFTEVARSVGTVRDYVARHGFRRPVGPSAWSWARMSLVDREEISRGLVAGESFRSIARRLGRAPSTISREVNAGGGRERYRAVEAEGRWRLAVRHHLHPDHPAASPTEAANRLVGLHSSDPATVFLSAWARSAKVTVRDLERCLYDRPTLYRVLGMRRTLFAVPAELVPLLHHGCARRLAPAERKRLVGYLE